MNFYKQVALIIFGLSFFSSHLLMAADTPIRGSSSTTERFEWCQAKLSKCLETAESDCGGAGTSGTTDGGVCRLSEGNICNDAYGRDSNCNTRELVSSDSVIIAPSGNQSAVEIPDISNDSSNDPQSTVPLVAPVKDPANAPAVARTAPKIDARGSRIQATGSSRPDVTQGVGKNSDVGVAALTKGECTKLGGTVKKMSMCKSGSGCQTTDENGSSHGVCITPAELLAPTFDREVQGNDSNGQGTSNSRLDFNKAIPQAGSTMAVPLTSQECTGLGGMVIATTNCESKGQKACSTVDQHGVIRIACINKVSK